MRRQLYAIALAIGVLLAGAYLTVNLHQEVKKQALSQFGESQLLIARHVAGEIKTYLDARVHDVKHIASLTSLLHLGATTMPTDMWVSLVDLKAAPVEDIFILDAEGNVAYSMTENVIGTGYPHSDVSAWAKEPANKGMVRLAMEKSGKQGTPASGEGLDPPRLRLFLATPLYHRKPVAGGSPGPGVTFFGTLLVTIDPEVLAKRTLVVMPSTESHSSSIWVMDGDGTVLLQPDHPEMVSRNIQERSDDCNQCHVSFDYVEKILTEKKGTLEFHLKGQKSKVAAFAPMIFENISWIVVVNTSKDNVTGFITVNFVKTLGIFVIVGLVLGIAFFFIYRSSGQEMLLVEKERHLQEKELLVEKLREAGDYLENLFDSANAPIIVWDPGLRITRFNRAFERLTGYTAGEAIGRELRTLFPGESREESLSQIAYTAGGEDREAAEIQILRKDGGIRFVLWNSANIRSGDGTAVVATIGQGKDITLRRQVEAALQESEEKFRSLFEGSRDAIMTLEPPSWRFTSGNPATVKMFGAKNEEDFVTYGPSDLSPERQPDGLASAEKAKEMIEAAVREGSRFFEWTHRRITGEEFPADVLLTRMGQAGKVSLQATVRDITERKQTERMKADFVSFATHQLRTPLSGIRWLLELAEQGEGLTGEVASLVADARTSADRLMTLVNDMLAVSRLEGGRLAVQQQPVNLSSVTTDVINELTPLIREKNHQISLLDGVSAPFVYADPQLVREVILNLLSNAIKYTPQDGSITVSMKAEGDMVEWAVHDTGIGVPLDAQRHLFEKFYRAENATVLNTEGTGLGLYLVKLVVERLDGRVWCESGEGQGSTFTFTLPIAKTVAQDEGGATA